MIKKKMLFSGVHHMPCVCEYEVTIDAGAPGHAVVLIRNLQDYPGTAVVHSEQVTDSVVN